jgi:hypothetical protein
MNWYKTASLIDSVTVVTATGSSLAIFINGRRYEYAGIPGTYWDGEIKRWKSWKNKRAAGEKLSNLIKNIDRYKVDPPKPQNAQPTAAPQPPQPKPGQQGELF